MEIPVAPIFFHNGISLFSILNFYNIYNSFHVVISKMNFVK